MMTIKINYLKIIMKTSTIIIQLNRIFSKISLSHLYTMYRLQFVENTI